MPIASNASKDRPSEVTSEIRPTAPWRVVAVEVQPDYCLKVRFVDGLSGTVRMKKMIWSPDAGVFESLRDPAEFGRARISWGAVTWPGELDLAPDAMYDEIMANGEWVIE
jgi:hypothetical protein